MHNLNRKNSFDDFGAEPSPLVWEKIEKRLPETRGKKRRWLLWWSAAAVFIAGIFLSTYLLDVQISLKRKGTAENSSTKNTDKTSTGIEKTNAEKNQLHITESSRQNTTSTAETASSEKPASSPIEKYRQNENKILTEESQAKKGKQKITAEQTSPENKTFGEENSMASASEASTDERTHIEKVPSKSIAALPLYPGDEPSTVNPASGEMLMTKNKPSVSRWQVMVSGGENYHYRVLRFQSSGSNSINEGDKNYLSENEKGIQTFSLETGASYSLSTHFNLNFGVNYFVAGQERNQSEIVFSGGIAGTPNTQYSVSTSVGVVTANGGQVDNALFKNNGSSLFSVNTPLTSSPTLADSSTTQHFNLKQEFSFIGLPLMVQYQTAEHRFTPYIGLGFSAGYILSESVTVNDQELDYQYMQEINTIIFFAEAQAGVKYRINKQVFFKLQPSFRYGLNSLSGNENIKWIPYSAGIGAGVNYRF